MSPIMPGTPPESASAPLPSPPRRGDRRARLRRGLARTLLMVSAVLVANALVGERGLVASHRARAEARALGDAIARLQAENTALRETARRLREDPRAIERAARCDLGLVRPGEVVVLVRR